MRILFYTSFNTRSRDTESLMEAFIKEKYSVYLLTQLEKGEYHAFSSTLGVQTFGHKIRRKPIILYVLFHWIYFIYFCWKHKIKIVYAHLEEPGLISTLAQYFIPSKVVVCRHIVDEAYLFENKNFILLNKIVYTLAKHVIVVSERAKRFMIEKEKVNPHKIHCIPLGYNFNFYDTPNQDTVSNIKEKYTADMLMITACRLVLPKRPIISIRVTEGLIKKGLDVKLLILGDGPHKNELDKYINDNNLTNNVYLLGFKKNIIDYLAAADILLHPSILDSSSVIIKEAGLLRKIVITCNDVGDVNDYLNNGINAFLVKKDDPDKEMIDIIENLAKNQNREKINQLKENLNFSVTKRFDIQFALKLYLELQNNLIKK